MTYTAIQPGDRRDTPQSHALLHNQTLGLIYNVLAYGAKGDGTTDDTSAVQAALNAAYAANGTCFIPAGRFRISAPLTVAGASYVGAGGGMSIKGTGQGSVISYVSSVAISELLFLGSSALLDQCTVSDLSLVYPSSNGPSTGHGIVANTHNLKMSNVQIFYAPQDAIQLASAGGQFNYLTNVTAWVPGRDGLLINGTNDSLIDGFVCQRYTRYGIYNHGGNNIKFVGCHPYADVFSASKKSYYQDAGVLTQIIGGQYEGGNTNIEFNGVSDSVVTGAQSYDYVGTSASSQILITNGSRMKIVGFQSIHNGNASDGIVIRGTAGVSVTNCSLTAFNQGVNVDNAAVGVIIQNNAITSAGFKAIRITNGSHCLIADNYVTSNGISEVSPSDFNIFHDNQLNGTALTVAGASSVSHNNMA